MPVHVAAVFQSAAHESKNRVCGVGQNQVVNRVQRER